MWNLTGHDRAIAQLETAIVADRLPHALLLTGPEGIGKRTLARALAGRLECIGAAPPCGTCIHCHQIALGSHPDVSMIERADGKESIVISQVRTLRDEASLKPYQGRVRVFIVAGAEALTAQAADALLKTLEEPQPQVQIMLTAVEADALPATILSRCRIVQLQPVPAADIANLLQVDHAPDLSETIASMAGGSVAWALQAAKQPKLVAQREEQLATLASAFSLDLEGRLQLVESLTAERRDRSGVRRSLQMLTLLARDAVLLNSGFEAETVHGEPERMLHRAVDRFRLDELMAYVGGLRLAMERVDANVDPRLALEALMVGLP